MTRCADLLRGHQSGMGQGGSGGKLSAGGCVCGAGGIPAAVMPERRGIVVSLTIEN